MNRWVGMAFAVVKAVVPGVAQVESIAKAFPTLKGKAKQDAVVDLVKASLNTAEFVTDKDLLNDPEVEKATRAVIDAVVVFQNIVNKKAGGNA